MHTEPKMFSDTRRKYLIAFSALTALCPICILALFFASGAFAQDPDVPSDINEEVKINFELKNGGVRYMNPTVITPNGAEENIFEEDVNTPNENVGDNSENKTDNAQVVNDSSNGSKSDSSATLKATDKKTVEMVNVSFKDRIFAQLKVRNPFGDGGKAAGFSQSGSDNSVASESQAPNGVVLTSIYCVDGKWFFVIEDEALKKTAMMQLGKYKSEDPYRVEFYDEETNSISLTNDLGSYTLTLKERDPLTGTLPNLVGNAKSSKNFGGRMSREQFNKLSDAQKRAYIQSRMAAARQSMQRPQNQTPQRKK